MRGRKPGQGTFAGGRPKNAPNRKGSMEEEIVFRCSAELFQALSLAAIERCEDSVHLYVRKYLEETHQAYLTQIREANQQA